MQPLISRWINIKWSAARLCSFVFLVHAVEAHDALGHELCFPSLFRFPSRWTNYGLTFIPWSPGSFRAALDGGLYWSDSRHLFCSLMHFVLTLKPDSEVERNMRVCCCVSTSRPVEGCEMSPSSVLSDCLDAVSLLKDTDLSWTRLLKRRLRAAGDNELSRGPERDLCMRIQCYFSGYIITCDAREVSGTICFVGPAVKRTLWLIMRP